MAKHHPPSLQQEELCLIMALVGVGNIVAASLQGACFKIFSELQSLGWSSMLKNNRVG